MTRRRLFCVVLKIWNHVLLAAVTAALIGLWDALSARTRGGPTSPLSTAVLGAGALATVALMVGVAQGFLLRLADRVGAPFYGWVERVSTRDPAADRAPVIALHVTITACLVAGGVYIVALDRLLRMLESVPDESVRRPLTLLVTLLSFGVALLLMVLARPPLRRLFNALDRRIGLPWPGNATLRRLLWLVVPLGAVLVALLFAFGRVLGVLAWPLALLLFVLLEVLVLALGQRLRPALRLPARPAIAVLAAVLLSAALLAGRAPANTPLANAPVVAGAFDVLRSLSDVDRDGFSSLYGGGDCAPLDSKIAPMRRDIPGNGIDEDCSGGDARSGKKTGIAPARRDHGDIAALGVKPRKYNIVWFMSEATRMDYTTLGGYDRGPTTPYLAELAAESLSFKRAYSQATATMLSVPSMLTGRDPGTMRWTKGSGRLQPDPSEVMLAERLRQIGYRTLMISDGYLKARLPGLHAGFDEVRSFWLDGKRMPWYRRAAAVAVAQSISMLEDDPALPENDQPFFLFAYLADPHDPYEPHSEGFPDFGRGETARYAGEIAFTDRYVGFFLDYLRYNPPLWDNTIVVFNGDHGEDFREHGTRTHGFNCNRQGTHVPLVVRIPGLPAAESDANVGLLDVVPTLFEAIGGEYGGMVTDGQSLLIPTFAKDSLTADRPIFCSTLLQGAGKDNFFWRGVRSADRALLHDAITGRRELYDTQNDFDETKNLFGRAEERENEERLGEMLENSLTGNLWDERLVP
jgi:arylsulfatase A-like enzyme